MVRIVACQNSREANAIVNALLGQGYNQVQAVSFCLDQRLQQFEHYVCAPKGAYNYSTLGDTCSAMLAAIRIYAVT